MIHVRRRIQRAQRAIHIDRPRAKRHRQALRRDHLKYVAGADVFLRRLDQRLVLLARETRLEVGFLECFRIEYLRIAGAGAAQAKRQFVESAQCARISLRLSRVGVHDQVEAPLEVVEHGDFVAQHQQHVRDAELVGPVPARQFRLDIADRLEAEVTDQAAAEIRHLRQLRHLEGAADHFDFGERIGQLAFLDGDAVLLDGEPVAV